jgi:hypothetical protein
VTADREFHSAALKTLDQLPTSFHARFLVGAIEGRLAIAEEAKLRPGGANGLSGLLSVHPLAYMLQKSLTLLGGNLHAAQCRAKGG